MANNAVVNRQVNVYINSGEAAKAYDKLIAKEKILNDELAKTTDPRRIKMLQAELTKLQEPITRAAKKVSGELAPSIRELELATKRFLNEFKKTGDPETLRKFQAFKAELDKAKVQLNGMSDANSRLTKGGIFSAAFWANLAANGVAKVTSLLGNFFGGAIQEALDADAATRRLQATLDNLGRGDTFDRISRKADEMAQKFRYLDNDDIVAVFNKLIDYGKLTEREMNDLLPVIIDFAAKSRISLEESTSVIIKALEGNGKALKEYGISIKDTGDETDRLNIIMTTLKEKVDGAGDAFQNSAAGGIATARQEFANLKEEIGNGLLPVLNGFLSFTSKMITGLGYLKNKIVEVGEDFVAYFKGGIGGVTANQAARDFERQQRSEAAGAQMAADAKTVAEIQKIIDDQFKRRATLVSLYQRGELTEQTFKAEQKRVDQLIRVYTQALDIRSKADSAINEVLGTGSDSGSTKTGRSSTKSPEKKVDLLAEAWKRLVIIQEKGREAVRGWSKEQEKALQQMIKLISLDANAVDTDALDQRVNNRRLAGLDFKVMTTRGKANLTAQLELLNEMERQELKSKSWTEEEKMRIEERYRQMRQQAETDFIQYNINNFYNYAQQALQIFATIGQAQTDRENAELERDRQLNEKKIKNLDNQLRRKLITQQQYDRQVMKIEQEQEKREKAIREKQFRRQQRADISQAIINGALAITSTLAAKPGALDILSLGAFRAINIGLAVATTAAQIATIASQKPPQFAAGGKLGGRSHADGGNAVIDGSGRKIAEVEAGEGIVNKRTMADRRRYSLSGTPSQIISSLNGMYGTTWESGATLTPAWAMHTPQRMNYTAMKKIYAAGGVLGRNTTNEATDNPVFENMVTVISNLQSTLASIQQFGIMADVSLTRFEDQEARLAAIRRDATMR